MMFRPAEKALLALTARHWYCTFALLTLEMFRPLFLPNCFS